MSVRATSLLSTVCNCFLTAVLESILNGAGRLVLLLSVKKKGQFNCQAQENSYKTIELSYCNNQSTLRHFVITATILLYLTNSRSYSYNT